MPMDDVVILDMDENVTFSPFFCLFMLLYMYFNMQKCFRHFEPFHAHLSVFVLLSVLNEKIDLMSPLTSGDRVSPCG